MKIRVISVLLLAALMLSVFTACGGSADVLTSEEAQKIALEEAGLTPEQVTDIHTHIVTENAVPCYSVHITAGEEEFSIIINAGTGEIVG